MPLVGTQNDKPPRSVTNGTRKGNFTYEKDPLHALAAMLGASVLVVGASPAAAETSFELRDTLILNADGSLTALVSYSCPAASEYYFVEVIMMVQQTKANATTSGNGSESGSRGFEGQYGLSCSGTLQTVAVTVRERSGPGFATGKAFADLYFRYCSEAGCTTSEPDQFVRITK